MKWAGWYDDPDLLFPYRAVIEAPTDWEAARKLTVAAQGADERGWKRATEVTERLIVECQRWAMVTPLEDSPTTNVRDLGTI